MLPVNSFKLRDARLWEMPNGGYVYIDTSVLDSIDYYRQFALEAPEAGGFLAGYYKGKDLHVINLTAPYSGDNYGRFHFHRRDTKHIKQVQKWYRESKGKINCLGEWHTHPEPEPRPSSVDIKSWSEFNQNRRGQQAIFLIAGTNGIWVGG